jgi:hypothetical protein
MPGSELAGAQSGISRAAEFANQPGDGRAPYPRRLPVPGSPVLWKAARVNDFDGELFLRLAGARRFSQGGKPGPEGGRPLHDMASARPERGRPLHAMASALVAVGAVPREIAQCVVQDWFVAEEVRHTGYETVRRFYSPRRQNWQDQAGALRSRTRFLTSGTCLERPWGTIEVRYVVLESDSTTVTVTMSQREELHGSGSGMYPAPWGNDYPDPMVFADDQGGKATATARPWGVCTPEVWHAKFHADQPLAVDTSWLAIDGQRLELTEPEAPVDVRIDPTPVPDPARGHLWLRVAEHLPPPVYVNTPLEPTVEALVAAGTLTWDDPDVQDALAVVSATDLLDPVAIFRAKHAPATRADPPPQRVREPWASLLADRDRGDGPNRLVLIGATTPTFDGVTIQFVALDSTPESFTLDVRIHDATASRWGDLHYGQPQVTWWAVDDRGNDYLGHLEESWSYAHVSGFGFGQVACRPPLDPSANWLDIMPTTATSRAVLRVPLP